MKQNTEEFEKELEDYKEQKKRFWFFGKNKKEEKDNKENGIKETKDEELKQDLKDLARISFTMMQKLPKETLATFKNSEEFTNFKEILSKHKIIK